MCWPTCAPLACAANVPAVDRWRIGDFAQRSEPIRDRPGHPLSPRSKEAYLDAMRQLSRDAQECGWIPRRFDPGRALATPRSAKARIRPTPRVIADDVWAKLLRAGLVNGRLEVNGGPISPLHQSRRLRVQHWAERSLRPRNVGSTQTRGARTFAVLFTAV
jgi:hypothetical protein